MRGTTLLLVRHGENDYVQQNRLAGREPGIHLNEKGLAQARRLAARISRWPIAAVYSSPLDRCVETATIIAAPHRLPLILHEGLLEADIGEWQGRKIEDLAKEPEWRVIQTTPSLARFPGGESMIAMQGRITRTMADIVADHPQQVLVICSHSDLIKAALAHYLGAHFDHFQRIHVSPASVSIVHLGDGGPRVVCVNETGDLRPPPAKPHEETGEPAAAESET